MHDFSIDTAMAEEAEIHSEETSHFCSSRLMRPDGASLRLVECGPKSAPVVVILNGPQMPAAFIGRLSKQLCHHYRVVSWEARGYNCVDRDLTERSYTFTEFYEDFLALVQYGGYQNASFVGICFGAALLVRAMGQRQITPHSTVLVTPSLPMKEAYPETLSNAALLPMLAHIAATADPVAAQTLVKLVAIATPVQGPDRDYEIAQNLVRIPFLTVPRLTAFAKIVINFMEQDVSADLATLSEEVLILGSIDDPSVAIDALRLKRTLFPNPRYKEFDTGKHLGIFVHPNYRDEVARYLDERHGLVGQLL